MADIMESIMRQLQLVDTAGVKDAGGKAIRFCKMPNGGLYPPFGEENIKHVKTTRVRPDDVFVCGYPKTGCHWTWEIINMILKGKGQYSKVGKVEGFLELSPPEVVEAIPSPRILNTHLQFDELPQEVREFNTKIVLTTRNPKDTAVSMYNHLINMTLIYNYEGKFEDWLPLWLDGINEYGHFVDYYLQWDKVIRENPQLPILVIGYEDMVEDLAGSIRKIAQFIDRPLSAEQISEITTACTFNTMKENFQHLATKVLLRKGKVGDWKDWLTVAASEQMDKWQSQLDKTVFKFKYTL